MPLADSSYPLLNVFWSIFIFFLWVIWIWMVGLSAQELPVSIFMGDQCSITPFSVPNAV